MKKCLAMLLCFLLFLGNAQAAVSVRMEDTAALLDMDGAEIVPPGRYSDIVSLGDGLFAAQQDGLWALMDGKGVLLTEPIYTELHIRDGLIIGRLDGKWGLLHRDGSRRCAFEYSLIVPSVAGNCWALRGDPNDMDSDKLYRIDPEGKQHATRIYVRALSRTAGEGLMSIIRRGGSKYGYCDALGRIAIEPAYDYAGDFANGVAAVVEGGRYGAINRRGETIVPAEYDFLEVSPSGIIIAARSGEGAWVFDLEGNETARHEGRDVYIAAVGDGYAIINSEFLYVFDGNGALQLEAPPTSVVLEGVNGQTIISDGMWGEECVYLSGTDVRYQNLYPLGTAGEEALYACMQANVGRYMNDLLGEVQLSTDMDSARYGVVNGEGELVVPCAYFSIEYLADDRLLVRAEDAWQMMDSTGRVLWQYAAPMQTEAPSF